jgi:hypothetical protein
MKASTTWAHVITLGTARFGQLQGGPFDGRCFPLGDDTPDVLYVPVEGRPSTDGARDAVRTLRYELRDGMYRFPEATNSAFAA